MFCSDKIIYKEIKILKPHLLHLLTFYALAQFTNSSICNVHKDQNDSHAYFRKTEQTESYVMCVNTSYRNIVNYVTGNVQNVVPGENLSLVFSSETTICDLYDKKNIN